MFAQPWVLLMHRGHLQDAEGSRRFTGSTLKSWGLRPKAREWTEWAGGRSSGLLWPILPRPSVFLASPSAGPGFCVWRPNQASGSWPCLGHPLQPDLQLACSVSPAAVEDVPLPTQWRCPPTQGQGCGGLQGPGRKHTAPGPPAPEGVPCQRLKLRVGWLPES